MGITHSYRVRQGSSDIVGGMLQEVIREWGLEEAKSILLTLDTDFDELDAESLPANVTVVRNVHRAINIVSFSYWTMTMIFCNSDTGRML